MNKRIAKKVLLCRSNLHNDWYKVHIARTTYERYSQWFRRQHIFLTYPWP